MRIWCSKRQPFHMLFPLLRHVVPLNDGICRLTTPVVKGRRTPPHTFNIGVFKAAKIILPQLNIFMMHLQTWLKVVMWLLNLMIVKFPPNGASDWQWVYGDKRTPSLHARLLDAGQMRPNYARCYWKLMPFPPKPIQSCYNWLQCTLAIGLYTPDDFVWRSTHLSQSTSLISTSYLTNFSFDFVLTTEHLWP